MTWLGFGLCTYISGKSALEEEGRHVGLPWHCRTRVPPRADTTEEFSFGRRSRRNDRRCHQCRAHVHVHDVCTISTRSGPLMLPIRVPAAVAVTGTGTGTCRVSHIGGSSRVQGCRWRRSRGRGRSPTYLGPDFAEQVTVTSNLSVCVQHF